MFPTCGRKCAIKLRPPRGLILCETSPVGRRHPAADLRGRYSVSVLFMPSFVSFFFQLFGWRKTGGFLKLVVLSRLILELKVNLPMPHYP